jgi:phage-related protein
MKPIEWLGTSKADLRTLPSDARAEAGYQLDRVQRGLDPEDWKPMTTVGLGVREIRIREDSGAFRVLYLAKLANQVLVLHVFQKTTEKTSLRDIALASKRLKQWKAKYS